MDDLWPKNIEYRRKRSPVTILREQASFLGKRTQNLVKAEVVDSKPDGMDALFAYSFFLVAPGLDYYRYQLFKIFHPITMYPVDFHVETEILEEISHGLNIMGGGGLEDEYVQADTEEVLLEVIRRILGATKTHRVITALLSQTDPSWAPNEPEQGEEIPF